MSKTIDVGGKALAGGKTPLICTSLTARDEPSLLRELAAVREKQPDLIEWRVDFFAGIGDIPRVVAMARDIRRHAGGLPLLFTRRSEREGGEATGLAEERIPALYDAVCASHGVDFIDYELRSDPAHFQAVRQAAHRVGVQLLASFHDFRKTPSKAELVATFAAMAEAGADLAKIAVMPRTMDDVLTLLDATLDADRRLPLPVIGIAMGAQGVPSRLFGGAFGSALTFAAGERASAPGQVPIDELRQVTAILQRAMTARS
ncbi:MAG TPA: type I 3-dehydroquinate dehydratase [Accumulibacter sp.]|jgi:3-dehydroquinate dehydratase-1|nr:type I 3-dehydroquinate dehydratase [Accumulibacter sp.]